MTSITSVAQEFFDACETGKGWGACIAYCTPDATFSAQAEPLLDVKTLAQYTEWMKGLLTILRDGRYEVKSFATDPARNNVSAYAVFHATHNGSFEPVPDFTPMNLRWSYTHETYIDGISPDMGRLCDFGAITDPASPSLSEKRTRLSLSLQVPPAATRRTLATLTPNHLAKRCHDRTCARSPMT